jgi:HrpA-like RNA helicase
MEERISKAAADQRKGRAGRTQPGVCYRLYTEEEFNKFKKFPTPDIQKTDITSDILDVFSLNYIKNTSDVRKFLQNLISPPSDDFIISSLNKLEVLGAVNNISNSGIVTDLGKAITQFRAIEPNFAKSILASYYYYCKYEVINIVLISIQIDGRIDSLFEKYYPKDKRLSEKEIKKEKEEYLRNQKRFHSSYGDYFTLLNVYNELKEYMKSDVSADARYWCKQNGISPRTFVSRNKKGNWDLIGEKARKINDILMIII